MSQRQSEKPTFDLKEKMQEIDFEFRDLLAHLTFKREHQLQTYSPIDAVQDFAMTGLQAVHELSRAEMMENDMGLRKLLANMLGQCKPGLLSSDDMEQLSGINGRGLNGQDL